MGRWSQRTRAGGGVSINFITRAEIAGSAEVQLTYLSSVDAAQFEPGDFESSPSTEPNNGVSQSGPTGLLLTFNSDVDLDASITYTGGVPGVLRPQTVLYT